MLASKVGSWLVNPAARSNDRFTWSRKLAPMDMSALLWRPERGGGVQRDSPCGRLPPGEWPARRAPSRNQAPPAKFHPNFRPEPSYLVEGLVAMPMTAPNPLDRGREAFGLQAWGEAYAQLSSADREAPLDPEDLERLGTAAHLLGREDESADIAARAHHEYLARGNARRAARCAFWVAMPLVFKGETARASGWVARGRRLLDAGQHDCAERGYLLLPDALRSIFEGDSASARAIFAEAASIGERFGDQDLVALA